MKSWAIGLMSNQEKKGILDQHKYLYDGYRTMQPHVEKEQPLYVQDFANDKNGVTVNNKNVVTGYKNVGINEQVESKDMCEQCGGQMTEGLCEQCGGQMEEEMQQVEDLKNVEDLNLSDKFDYVEGEVEETQQGNPYDDMSGAYTFKSKGPEEGDGPYSEKSPDMDLDMDDIKSAFDFESDGSETVYETMESAFSQEDTYNKEPMDDITDETNEETIVLDLESELEENEDPMNDVDEDLRESVRIQKTRIVEMFNRIKKY